MIIDTLLIDTGSAITWVGASQKYVPTNSSGNTGGIIVCVLSLHHSILTML